MSRIADDSRCKRAHCSTTESAVLTWCTTGTALMNSPTMVSTPGRFSGRPDTMVPKTTSRRSVSLLSTTAHANSTAVLRVRPLRPAHCRSRTVSAAGNSNSVFSGTPSPAATVPSATMSGPDTPCRYVIH